MGLNDVDSKTGNSIYHCMDYCVRSMVILVMEYEMNERIKELVRQADVHILPDDSEYGHCIIGLEKFAELIVQECMQEIRHKSFELLDIDFYPHYLERLKKHFGVK